MDGTTVKPENKVSLKFDCTVICSCLQVETVGDKYMAVSGLPEPCQTHARCMARLALDMMDLVREVQVDGEPVVSTSSSSVMTGIQNKQPDIIPKQAGRPFTSVHRQVDMSPALALNGLLRPELIFSCYYRKSLKSKQPHRHT